MVAVAVAGALARSYLAGAARSFGAIRAGAAANGIRIGNYNALMDLNSSDAKATVSLPDLKALERELKLVGPKAFNKFKSDARKLGNPARDDIRRAFASVGYLGPTGGPKRPGRLNDKMVLNPSYAHLSWGNSVNMANRRGVDVNYKMRNASKELQNLRGSRDGTISIVRVVVRSPAYIVADMAGKSRRAMKSRGQLSREYQIDLFGRGVVTRRHRVSPANTANWIRELDMRAHNKKQSKPSRYAWPTMEKHAKTHRKNASKLFNETIAEINRILEK